MSAKETSTSADHQHQELDDQGTTRAVTVVRSTNFWFDDGNLVLQAEGTQFKVHRGLLARHSCVLRDMLSLPQPSQQQDLQEQSIDGCPVVVLCDKAKYWAELLGVLYDGHRYIAGGKALPFPLVDATLRLGHKYEFDGLKQAALECLSKQFPVEREKFNFSADKAMDEAREDTFCYLDDDHSFNDVIELAAQLRLDRLLPTIYLQALILASESPDFLYAVAKSRSGEITELSRSQQKVLVKSHARLASAVSQHQLACLVNKTTPNRYSCSQLAACSNAIRTRIVETWIPMPKFHLAFNAFDGSLLGDGACGNCKAALNLQFEEGKRSLWSELPQVFGLPPWGELKNLTFG
ncbi:hypothetical protein BKA70DRAFT_1283492 [Coprinopsis sp. MPI-PUGE-AT-0042]|nr:hypothetical protein BKA70DRAFT_1283492 [Coprinopsis sp. MPI-PUGE-AT-0042]